MSNKQYTVSNTAVATTAFTVPGDQGSSDDDSFQVEGDALAGAAEWYVHVENGFDANVDVTVQGSHYNDESMTAPVADGAAETISAGANGAFSGTSGHSYLEVSVTPATDPTAGDLTVTFQARGE